MVGLAPLVSLAVTNAITVVVTNPPQKKTKISTIALRGSYKKGNPMTTLTSEQSDIISHCRSYDGITLVSAGAGCGKTFIAHQLVEDLNPSKGLYTAFNKAIVTEGVDRFDGMGMECKTLHALAYKYCSPKRKIEDLSYTCITEKISYPEKFNVITAIDQFYVSSSVDMYEYMDTVLDSKELQELACKYVELMVAGEIAPTFNFLLKYFHLMLKDGSVTCKYDIVILDEINDTTAVALEIFKLIDAPKKIGLGEPNQAIYKFLNLVDGFEELEGVPLFPLTRSFRCSKPIASRIDRFMVKYANKDFDFIGSADPVANGKQLYCTSTNAAIVKEIHSRLAQKKGFHLLRKPSEIFACPLAIMTASRGKSVFQKKYKFLETEYKNFKKQKNSRTGFFSYLIDTTKDREVEVAVGLLLYFQKNGINVFDIYREAKEAEVDTKYTISTVFTSKGLEFETVHIADDLNRSVEDIVEAPYPEKGSDELVALRCYYVACSRAGTNLVNAIHLPH